MIGTHPPDESKQDAKLTTDTRVEAGPKKLQPPASSQDAHGKPAETNPGGDPTNALTSFEEKSLIESRKMMRVTAWAFGAALIGAFFIALQFIGLTHQNQILSAQAISATAGAVIGELNTIKQLNIAQRQATAAQDSVEAIKRQMRQDQRPWIRFDLSDPKAGPKTIWPVQIGGTLNVPVRFTTT
jgi:hypothetical protein